MVASVMICKLMHTYATRFLFKKILVEKTSPIFSALANRSTRFNFSTVFKKSDLVMGHFGLNPRKHIGLKSKKLINRRFDKCFEGYTD